MIADFNVGWKIQHKAGSPAIAELLIERCILMLINFSWPSNHANHI